MRITIILLLVVGLVSGINAQNLDIQGKAKIHSVDTGAVLDLQGEGLLLPRMTTQERNNMSNVRLGLVIFNTSTRCIEIYIDEWIPMCSRYYITDGINNLLGGVSGELPRAIGQTSDGGYVVAGYSFSSMSGDVSGISNGGSDYWIVKLDNTGGVIWDVLLGGDSSEVAEDIAQTTDGGYIVAGYSFSSSSGDINGNNHGKTDIWIVKLSQNGIIEWDTLIGGDDGDFARSIIQTSDGGYVVAGSSYSSFNGDVSETTNGLEDYWIVKLNSEGDIEWDRLIGGTAIDAAHDVAEIDDGHYIVVGTSASSVSGDVTETNHGLTDCWIVKLDSMGVMVWDTLIGGDGYDQASAVENTAGGGFIVSASSSSSDTGDVTGINHGSNDFWIVSFDNSSDIEWDILLGGNQSETARRIITTSDGGYLVAGQSDSSLDGDVTDPNNGPADFWIVKLDSGGSVEWSSLLGGSDGDIPYGIAETPEGMFVIIGSSASSMSGDVLETNHGSSDYWLLTLGRNGNRLK